MVAPTRSQPNLFDAAQSRDILARLDRLRADTPALWGKMDVAQMLAHCQVPLEVAMGDVELKRGLIGILFGRMAKRKLLAPGEFGRNMPTHPRFRVSDARAFAREHARLRGLVQKFASGGPAVLTRAAHPFFGPLTEAEWSALQWKHLDHHLRQFGV